MRGTVRSYGFVGVLKSPVTHNIAAMSALLWEANTDIDITQNGELVFLDYNRNADYETRSNLFFMSFGGEAAKGDPRDLTAGAAAYGLFVLPQTIRSFNCIWSSSKNNPISLLKKPDFLIQTQQKD
jgi:hypothetical protein